MLPLDDLGGYYVLLKIGPSRTISSAGNDKKRGDANVIGIWIRGQHEDTAQNQELGMDVDNDTNLRKLMLLQES